MIPQNTIETIRQVSIVNYLLSVGIKPVKQSGNQLVYRSPFKPDESTPSFFVEPQRNVFKDFTTKDKGGDIITLVQRLNDCSFIQAVQLLNSFDGSNDSFSLGGQRHTPIKPKEKTIITKVQPIKDARLWKYLADRSISPMVANAYLKEVHFKIANKRGFALGFANDRQGYELRNPFIKSSVSPKCPTTFEVPNSQSVNLFEGFFDFLSCCEYLGRVHPLHTTIVLNSLSNLNHVLERLKTAKQVNVYFDNDPSGKEAFERIKQTGVKVFDGSKHYEGFKDFNDYITGKK